MRGEWDIDTPWGKYEIEPLVFENFDYPPPRNVILTLHEDGLVRWRLADEGSDR